MEQALKLSSTDFEILCLELIKTGRLTKEEAKRIKNCLIDREKRAFHQAKKGSGSGQPSTVDPGPSTSAELSLHAGLPAPLTKVRFTNIL